MATYHFVTHWRLRAPLPAVFRCIEQSLDWPRWWPGVESVVELSPGEPDGTGNVRRYCWRGRLPYRLNFTATCVAIEPARRVQAEVSGDVAGSGTWLLMEQDGVTDVCYEWQVRTTRWWMRLLSPWADPVFRWNHDWLMKQGGRALAKELGAELLANEQGGR